MRIQYKRIQSARLRISPHKRALTAKEIEKDLRHIGLEVSQENIERFRRTFRERE
jgi:hypothetical protein